MRNLLSAIVLVFVTFYAQAETLPGVTVKTVADQVLANILQNKDQIKSDKKYIAKLVERVMIPIIDQNRMARLALGRKTWQKLSDQQKADFIRGFKGLLIKTYSGAFKAYNGQEVSYGKTRFNKDKSKAIVASKILQPGGKSIELKYYLEKHDDGNWKVFDAKVAGFGIVKTYQAQFADQIKKDGIDKTIQSISASLN